MPKCINCSNMNRFGSSKVVSSRKYNEPHGMSGHFSTNGGLLHLEYNNASSDLFNSAWQSPERFFDTCLDCGSTNLLW